MPSLFIGYEKFVYILTVLWMVYRAHVNDNLQISHKSIKFTGFSFTKTVWNQKWTENLRLNLISLNLNFCPDTMEIFRFCIKIFQFPTLKQESTCCCFLLDDGSNHKDIAKDLAFLVTFYIFFVNGKSVYWKSVFKIRG